MKHTIRNYDGSRIEEDFRMTDAGRRCYYYIDGNQECTVEQLAASNGTLNAPFISWSARMTTDIRFTRLFIDVLEFASNLARDWNLKTGKAIADIPDWY